MVARFAEEELPPGPFHSGEGAIEEKDQFCRLARFRNALQVLRLANASNGCHSERSLRSEESRVRLKNGDRFPGFLAPAACARNDNKNRSFGESLRAPRLRGRKQDYFWARSSTG